MDRLAVWIADHRRFVLGGVVVMTIAAGVGLPRRRFDDRPRGVFKANDEAHALLEEVFADFGSDDNDCVLVVESQNLFTGAWISGSIFFFDEQD